jgi:HSP20 family molecular chaperone IbpA
MMPTTLTRWRDTVFAPFEAGGPLFPFVAPEIRVEQVMEDGRYVIRAEIPGVDPTKDIDVSVQDGAVTIRADRTTGKPDAVHSEFHYGRLVRVLALPTTALEETAEATYDNGILRIAFAVGEPARSAHHIAITIARPADPQPQKVTTEKKEVPRRTR